MRGGYFGELILQLGQSLAPDESFRTVCPACNGGHSKERSFTMKRVAAGITYNCFRAKCGVHGLIGDGPRSPATKKEKKGREPYKGQLVGIPSAIFARFFIRYGLGHEDIDPQGIKFASDIGRLYFPIYDYRGYTIGENLKAVSISQKPKNLFTKFSDNVPMIHVPLGTQLKDTVVLVEAQIYALKVNKVTPCMALMGTFCSDGCLSLLRQIGIKEAHIMLDGDDAGITGALKLLNRLNPFFNTRSIIVPKGKDPKDLSLDEIRSILI